jgi:hypothetical protein
VISIWGTLLKSVFELEITKEDKSLITENPASSSSMYDMSFSIRTFAPDDMNILQSDAITACSSVKSICDVVF